jgi:GTPase SAR1 family protein
MQKNRRPSETLNENRVSKNSYDAIVIGDPYCGKSTYLKRIVQHELAANQPVRIWENQNEIEFLVSSKDETFKNSNNNGNNVRKGVFKVKDTASN